MRRTVKIAHPCFCLSRNCNLQEGKKKRYVTVYYFFKMSLTEGHPCDEETVVKENHERESRRNRVHQRIGHPWRSLFGGEGVREISLQ